MKKELQAKLHIRVFSLSILLVVLSSAMMFAQVPLKDSNPIEVRFSTGSDQVTPSTYVVSLDNISSLTGRNLPLEVSEWSEISDDPISATNYYLSEGRQFISPGRVQISGSDVNSFFTASFINSSEMRFTGMLVSFDFVYNKTEFRNHHNLRLHYRVNGADWRLADGGYFSTYSLSEGDEMWNTMSIQLNIDDIFLRQEDQIDLMWIFDGVEDVEDYVPLFMQRVEVHPEESRQESLEHGSVIITEIMPPFVTDGVQFEYLELYNPNNRSVSLRGLEVISSAGTHVVQRDLILDPYEVLVLSNVDISNLNTVRNNYIYDGSIIPESGRVELRLNSSVIANATFEAADPGVSLYLDRVLNSHDGYTSMRNLIPSEESFFADMFGAPGILSGTLSLYKHTITEEGWHLVTLPGFLVERMSRNPSVEFFELNGERILPDRIEPNTPVFIHKTDQEPFTIFVEEDRRARQTASIERFTKRHPDLRMVSLSIPAGRSHASSGDLMNMISPLVNVWDVSAQEFTVSFAGDLQRDIWTPVFLNSELLAREQINDSGLASRTYIERYISFTLREGSGNQRRLLDSAVLGFLDQPAGRTQVRYDLPKLETVMPATDRVKGNYLYLTSEKSTAPTNSFTHLPYEPEESYRIGLGTDLVMQSSNMLIEWNLNQNIPDEWIITLEDTQTGTTTDMREVNQYRFRSSGGEPNEPFAYERTETEISVLRPEERNRFFVSIMPFERIEAEEETVEVPGSVELRPNYPNPFNPSTNITFYLPEERPVRLGIYNIVGQQVALLMDDTFQSGEHSVVWDATNNPSGIYIIQLETGNRTLTRKITLIK